MNMLILDSKIDLQLVNTETELTGSIGIHVEELSAIIYADNMIKPITVAGPTELKVMSAWRVVMMVCF